MLICIFTTNRIHWSSNSEFQEVFCVSNEFQCCWIIKVPFLHMNAWLIPVYVEDIQEVWWCYKGIFQSCWDQAWWCCNSNWRRFPNQSKMCHNGCRYYYDFLRVVCVITQYVLPVKQNHKIVFWIEYFCQYLRAMDKWFIRVLWNETSITGMLLTLRI